MSLRPPYRKRAKGEIPISLAEAMLIRKDYQKWIEGLTQRVLRNAQAPEGENPREDPQTLLAEIDATLETICELDHRINLTQTKSLIEGELTLLDAISERDLLAHKMKIYESLAEQASHQPARDRLSDLRTVSSINLSYLHRQIERLARDYRSLDTKIQQASWNTELLY